MKKSSFDLLYAVYAPASQLQDDDTVTPSEAHQNRSKTFFDVSPNFAIHIIGERHSGVNLVEKELQRCFGHAIYVSSGLMRSAHWWQSPSIFAASNSSNTDLWADIEYGIVVALFRNPYDWVEAMRLEPQHALEHYNIVEKKPLEWQEFLTTPWTVDRFKYKDLMTEDNR